MEGEAVHQGVYTRATGLALALLDGRSDGARLAARERRRRASSSVSAARAAEAARLRDRTAGEAVVEAVKPA